MRRLIRAVVTAALAVATFAGGGALLAPSAAAAGAPVEICDPDGCYLGRVAMHAESDSTGKFLRLYVCDFFNDGHVVAARVDFGTEVRQFADPNVGDQLCNTHIFRVSVRKFRMVVGDWWASDWKAPPAL